MLVAVHTNTSISDSYSNDPLINHIDLDRHLAILREFQPIPNELYKYLRYPALVAPDTNWCIVHTNFATTLLYSLDLDT